MVTASAGQNGVNQLVAKNYIHRTDEEGNAYTTFNLVFTGIQNADFDSKIWARSYVVTADGVTHYSPIASYSYNDIASAVLADDSVDDATKDAVAATLNA